LPCVATALIRDDLDLTERQTGGARDVAADHETGGDRQTDS
jgi:hypothetical protein